MLPPGATIGILGGGQLGRMLALAAAPLGLRTHVYAPEAEAVAAHVAGAHTRGAYDDRAALEAFAARVDVVTPEFENVPAETAAILSARVPVRPNSKALAIAQDRLPEKMFLRDLGLAVAGFVDIPDARALDGALADLSGRAVLKTRRLGYDGKGQIVVAPGEDAAAAFAAIGAVPAILEAFVPFVAEVSIIAARGVDGAVAAYDLTLNRHEHHILARSTAPAPIAERERIDGQARRAAQRIMEALDYVGVLAVEFFLTAEGKLLVNEIAPRVHNSGHWTIEGAETSQFEQQIRAVAGWPLGSTRMRAREAVMENIIGDDVRRVSEIAAEPGAHLHLYGKSEPRPGRKMGHVTRLSLGLAEAPAQVRR